MLRLCRASITLPFDLELTLWRTLAPLQLMIRILFATTAHLIRIFMLLLLWCLNVSLKGEIVEDHFDIVFRYETITVEVESIVSNMSTQLDSLLTCQM